MAHLLSPRDSKSLLPEGQKRENQLVRGVSGGASCESSKVVSSESPSDLSSWLSLDIWSPSTSALASAISPGFLSNSPLNCFLAFFSTSCRWIDIRIKC